MDLRDVKEFFIDISKYIIVAVVIIAFILFVATIQQVVGPSMSTTLNNGDIVILNKISYRFTDIKRNDIVSLFYADTKYLIKRVIGLPGEKIEYKDNILYINDVGYKEENITKNTNDFSIEDLGYDKIPEDMYLVLGDNREDSLDSRTFGLVDRKDILGKVGFRFWPLNKISFIK